MSRGGGTPPLLRAAEAGVVPTLLAMAGAVLVGSVQLDDGRLQLEVHDDGQWLRGRLLPPGPAGPEVTGVGLVAMRERAAELGGTCSIESGEDGTRVRAWLPVPGR